MSGWEEILFENRNKKYGSYQLRKKYHKYLLIGLLLSITFVFLTSAILFVICNSELFFTPKMPTSISIESLQIANLQDLLMPEPPSTQEKAASDVSKPIIIDSTKQEHSNEEALKSKIKSADKDSIDKKGKDSALSGKEAKMNGDSLIYLRVDKMPEFSGAEGFGNFLRKNFSQSVLRNKARIRVIVEFTVTKNGDTNDVLVVTEVASDIKQEILRVMNILPSWIPAQQAGHPVMVRYRTIFNL